MIRVGGESPSAFAILPSGRILPVPLVQRPDRAQKDRPEGFVWIDRQSETWADIREGHLVILRGRRTLWRSSGTYPVHAANRLNAILVSPRGVAFQVRMFGPLYLAPGREAERRVAQGEWPEAWTRSGNLISVRREPSNRTFAYVVRSPNGRRLATLASGLDERALNQRAAEVATGTFLFWTPGGDLFRTDGGTTILLANYRGLGFSAQPHMYLLDGGLIELLSRDWREVILRSDGSVFARASAPANGSVAGFGDQVASPNGRAVAYVLWRPEASRATLFVLRKGDHRPATIYRTSAATLQGKGGILPSWHWPWLLFAPPGESAVAIDSTGRHLPLEFPTSGPWLPGPVERIDWATSLDARRIALVMRGPGRDPPCTPTSEDIMQGDTLLGRWLLRMLKRVGGPEDRAVRPSLISERYYEFFLELPEYQGRFEVSVFAEPPDFVNVELSGIPVVERTRGYTLRGGWARIKGSRLQQFIVAGRDVWVTMHVFPMREGIERDAVVEWFRDLAQAARREPPPECP